MHNLSQASASSEVFGFLDNVSITGNVTVSGKIASLIVSATISSNDQRLMLAGVEEDESAPETQDCFGSWQERTNTSSQEEICAIIDAYGQQPTTRPDERKTRQQTEYRRFEKKIARKYFKIASDWENTEKVNGFLKESARAEYV